jgi:structure-specific recognition protein 1
MEKSHHNNIENSKAQLVKGWTWGDVKITDNRIEFELDNKNWFNIPYTSISNALLPSKNEIGLEFNIEDEDLK